jgi:hypothetical protein
MKYSTITALDKNNRNSVRNNIINLFPKEKEIYIFHPNCNNILVSNYGNVKNSITGTIFKSYKNRNNYNMVNVKFNDGRGRRSVFNHRLVAETFLSHFDNSNYIFEVNHISGNKEDNSLYNLEWMTRQENLQHARDIKLFKSNGYYKFNLQSRIDMQELYKLGFKINEIARSFNADRNTVSKIVKGKKNEKK